MNINELWNSKHLLSCYSKARDVQQGHPDSTGPRKTGHLIVSTCTIRMFYNCLQPLDTWTGPDSSGD